jgi:hypothetical protein
MIDLSKKLGALINYYLDGWRYGYLVSIRGKIAKVQPISAYKAPEMRCVRIPVGDFRGL